MIKQTKDGEPIFIPPAKILQELKYLHKELPAFCYSWAWEARCVCAFEKGEFIEAIKELKVAFVIYRSYTKDCSRKLGSKYSIIMTLIFAIKISIIIKFIDILILLYAFFIQFQYFVFYKNSVCQSYNKKQIGCQKRCEVYAKKPILIGKRLFNVRLISYGASSPKKMFFGPNHLAHAFDKLMFDYVYIFLETPQKTAKKLQLLIQKAESIHNNRQIASFKESYKILLGKEYEEQNMEEEQIEDQE